jgi:hypothetical protein
VITSGCFSTQICKKNYADKTIEKKEEKKGKMQKKRE